MSIIPVICHNYLQRNSCNTKDYSKLSNHYYKSTCIKPSDLDCKSINSYRFKLYQLDKVQTLYNLIYKISSKKHYVDYCSSNYSRSGIRL